MRGQAAPAPPPAPAPHGYDPEVWKELPPEIQQELIQAMNTRPKSQQQQIRQEQREKEQQQQSEEPKNKNLNIFPLPNSKKSSEKLRQLSLNFSQAPSSSELDSWKDPSFPPLPCSVDGRKEQKGSMSVSSLSSSSPKCQCGKGMVSRQVSKVGINQGRYFYSCPVRQCNSFIWAEGVPHRSSVMNLEWRYFHSSEGWKMVTSAGYLADDIIQGNIGDCWFLSAVAVLCERSDLLETVMGRNPILTPNGQSFRFFVNGEWKEILVDCYLPCLSTDNDGASLAKKRKFIQTNGPLLSFSRAKRSQLWVSLLEKAYAKLYGYYDALHGGHIPEALFDLTGCPCESIHTNSFDFHSEETWMKLMSYRSLGFPMGCSTDFSGEGIVGNHAYSILDIREIHDMQLGEQLSIRTFLRDQSSSLPPLPPSREEECLREVQFTGHLRLLRIRNPWGKREWNGNFSSHSSLWTSKLKQLLSSTSSNSNSSCSVDHQDGSFWITFTDFLRRFVTIDICKAYRSPTLESSFSLRWNIHCLEDLIDNEEEGVTDWQSISTRSSFVLIIHESQVPCPSIPIYISLLQESKRGNPQRRSIPYSDLSALIRHHPSGKVVGSIFSSPMRSTCPVEITLDPGIYVIQIMKFSPSPRSSSPFPCSLRRYWIHLYSAQHLSLQHLLPTSLSLSPFHPMPIGLIHFLDDLTSALPHSTQNSCLSMLTHLCSSSTTFPLQVDIFLLRGNGMNLLFCRSKPYLSASHLPNVIDLSEDQSSQNPPDDSYSIELTVLHRSSHITIVSPFLLSTTSTNMTTMPKNIARNSLGKFQENPIYSLTTSSFRHQINWNQIKILGIIFDTTGGSDSFEFLGEVYLHTAAVQIIPISNPTMGEELGSRKDQPSHFHSYDCQ